MKKNCPYPRIRSETPRALKLTQKLTSLLDKHGRKSRQLQLNPSRLVFLDETAVSTKMARLYGRCPRGERLRCKKPHGH